MFGSISNTEKAEVPHFFEDVFERGDALVERADRLEERGEVPLILIDASEQVVDIPVLQFPLWLAFAAGPGETDDLEDLL